MNDSKKVLFIAYYFPPVGGGGVQRSAKFVKYLGKFNWTPLVLTVREPYDFYRDQSLLDDVPETARIYRTLSIEPMKWVRKLLKSQSQKRIQKAADSKTATSGKADKSPAKKSMKPSFLVTLKTYLLVPDNEILWLPFAVWKGLRIIRKEKPGVIYSTASPFTDHLIGYLLSKFSGLPWVADFRDPWVDRANFPQIRWRLFIDRYLEKKVVRGADHVLTTSEPTAELYRQLYPGSRCSVITNGFDEDDFQHSQKEKADVDRFIITYTGIFNRERNPLPLFAALGALIDRREDFRERIELRIIGQLDNPGDFDNYNALKGSTVEPFTRLIPYQPHATVLTEMQSANLLFLMVGEHPQRLTAIPGKIFEYLRARRPILGALPAGGAAAEIVTATHSGIIVSNTDADSIQKGIETLFDLYLQGKLQDHFEWKNIDQFERRILTGRLAEILDEVGGKR